MTPRPPAPRPPTPRHVAVIDIGKTNAKLALVALSDLSEIAVLTRPNTVRPGPPWPHFDLDGHWAFLLDALGAFHRDHGIDAISVTTHGASGVLLTADGALAAPMLDYEHDGPDESAAAYDALRPPFSETGSPRLPGGLNLGAQIHWQFEMMPGLRERTATILTYPQYWGHRLTGVAASDVTSLGCHTDLWNPAAGDFSPLVGRLGIRGMIAAPRPCADVLGHVLPAVAAATGLPRDTPVHVGIHDSNASLLPHIIGREVPFGVVSTGTWIIAMAVGGAQVTLDPARDTLVNVSALGQPVPSARFMGGRDFDRATGGDGVETAEDDIRAVLDQSLMLLPQGQWWHPVRPEAPGQRVAAASFAMAMRTARSLELIGHRGAVIVEGPFARNRAYLALLAAATGHAVIAAGSATGTSQGTALLAAAGAVPKAALPTMPIEPPAAEEALRAYAQAWRREAMRGV